MPTTNLSLPEEGALRLPTDNYDLRVKDAVLKETKEEHHPMLELTFEIVAPTSKKCPPAQEPVDIAGIEVRYWVVFYGRAIAELEAIQGDQGLDSEQEEKLKKFKNLQSNRSFGSLVKMGAIHQSMGLPLENFDEELVDASLYIGRTCCAIVESKTVETKGSDGKVLTDIKGQKVVRYNYNISRFVGPARWPDQHMAF